MSYWGFDGRPHIGTMVVNNAVTAAVLKVFGRLFAEHFPIHQMQPEDAYGGQDPVSMADDNTSGFNCRYAVAPGPPSWSVHAYGEAIDVNPVENPYLEGGQVQPPAGAPFLDRSDVPTGDGGPGRSARGGLRLGGLVVGRALDVEPRLPALLGHRRLRAVLGESAVEHRVGCSLGTFSLGSAALFGQDERSGSRLVLA